MDEKWVEMVMDILANLIITSYQQDNQKEEQSQQ